MKIAVSPNSLLTLEYAIAIINHVILPIDLQMLVILPTHLSGTLKDKT